MILLLTAIEWDCSEVLARSLPTKILVLNAPENVDPESDTFQRFMLARFGAKTVGLEGIDPLKYLTCPRQTVEMVRWDSDTPIGLIG